MRTHMITLGIVLALMSLTHPMTVSADKSYGLPTLSGQPRRPDILKDQGGNVRYPPWGMIVAPGTFTYDMYFRTGCWRKSGLPLYIGRYWQVSDICEFWPRPHTEANSAPAVSTRPWIIRYEYQESELDILGTLSFPEESLKIVFSDDHGETWTMLKSSTVDTENNTVAAITDGHGGYMVMAGFVGTKTFYNYKEVKGVSVSRGHENEARESDSNSGKLGGANPLRTLIEGVLILIGRFF